MGLVEVLRAYQWMMEVDRYARLFNQARLRQLSQAHREDLRLFCSHDAVELKTFAEENDTIRVHQPIFD